MSGFFEEVYRVLEGARALPESERDAFLARATASEDVRRTVRRMLAGVSEGFLEHPFHDPVAGSVLGDFELLEELGRGAMGIVFRARQRSLGRIVALKVLPAHAAFTQRRIDRFEREAHAAARLAHPHVVTIHLVGRERAVRYIVMELVEGPDLEKELLRRRAELGITDPLPPPLATPRSSAWFRWTAEVVRQAADGLAHAHASGIVHRDVKPSNLLLAPTASGPDVPHVKIVDFGLARDDELGTLTTQGDFLGTPHYVSPEQARARRNEIDHRTDVYSLGVVLYELLTLRRPFEGQTSREVLDQVLARDAPRVRRLQPDVPAALETLCAKAMARDPDERFDDAGALRDELARFLDAQPIATRPYGLVRRSARWCGRRKRLVSTAALAVASVGLGLTLASYWSPTDQLPTLTLRAVDARGAPVGAEVFLREIDLATSCPGAARSLGPAPLDAEPVPDVPVRLAVAFDDGGLVELALHPGLTSDALELEVVARPEHAALAGTMLTIPGGSFTFPVEAKSPYSGATVQLESFLLDATETSNGEYRRFLEATGRPPPAAWTKPGYDPAYDDLPVVGLSYAEVTAYLAWAGKRLPTAAEWQRAALGTELRAFPWSADTAAEPRGNVGGPSAYVLRGADPWRRYLEEAAPVRSYPEACSPEGAFHLYGNVLEWTESVMCLRVEGELVPSWADRIFYGGAWDADPTTLRAPGYEAISAEHGLSMLGFRGARSLTP